MKNLKRTCAAFKLCRLLTTRNILRWLHCSFMKGCSNYCLYQSSSPPLNKGIEIWSYTQALVSVLVILLINELLLTEINYGRKVAVSLTRNEVPPTSTSHRKEKEMQRSLGFNYQSSAPVLILSEPSHRLNCTLGELWEGIASIHKKQITQSKNDRAM